MNPEEVVSTVSAARPDFMRKFDVFFVHLQGLHLLTLRTAEVIRGLMIKEEPEDEYGQMDGGGMNGYGGGAYGNGGAGWN